MFSTTPYVTVLLAEHSLSATTPPLSKTKGEDVIMSEGVKMHNSSPHAFKISLEDKDVELVEEA